MGCLTVVMDLHGVAKSSMRAEEQSARLSKIWPVLVLFQKQGNEISQRRDALDDQIKQCKADKVVKDSEFTNLKKRRHALQAEVEDFNVKAARLART